MIDQVTATIEFDYKGKRFAPTAILDLDLLMQQYGTIPPLYQLLANLNNIDSYSYEYEILLSQTIVFTDAQGLATDFVQNNHFDQIGFEQSWHQQRLYKELAPMLKQQLEINDIEQYPEIKKIILAAYQLGKKAQS